MKTFDFSILIKFFFLVFLQVILFNGFYFLGTINPLIYVFFFFRYRLDKNQTQFILVAFLLGFTIDLLTQSAGGHTISATSIAYLRPRIISLSLGRFLKETSPSLNQISIYNQFLFLMWIVLIHHLIYFFVIFLSFSSLLIVFQKTFFTGIFTLVFIWIGHLFFKQKK